MRHRIVGAIAIALLAWPSAATAQLPFTESFDSFWQVIGPSGPGTETSLPGWSWAMYGPESFKQWHREDYPGFWQNPSAGAYSPPGASGTPHSARFHTAGIPNGGSAGIVSPTLDFSACPVPKYLKFSYINTSGTDRIYVLLSTNDGASYGSVLAQLDTATTWKAVTVDLGNELTPTAKIQIYAMSDGGDTDIGVDQVRIECGLTIPGGTYLVGDDQPVLKKLTDVATQLTGVSIAGNVTYELTSAYDGTTGETLPIPFNPVTSSGGPWTVTIRPRSGVSMRTTSGSSATSVVRLAGADRFVLDGRAGGTGSTTAWTVANTNTTGGTGAVWVSSLGAAAGATNNTVEYLTLTTGANPQSSSAETFGIASTGTTISTASDGADNDGNTYFGNTITRARWGIYLRGATGNPNDNTVVSQNTVGPASFGANEIGRGGIVAQLQTAMTISRNIVQFVGGPVGDTAPGADRIGIGVGTNGWPAAASEATNVVVTRNYVRDVVNEKGFSAVGIALASTAGTTNNTVDNNQVLGVRANGTVGDQGVGIGIGAGNGDVVADNSVYLAGDVDPAGATTATQSEVGIRIATTSALNLRLKNNVIWMGQTSNTGTLRHFGIVAPSTAYAWGTGGSDHNDYWADPSSSQATLGGIGTTVPYTPVSTLGGWQTQFTPNQDLASLNEAPPFVSTSNLHLQPGVPTRLESHGEPLAGIVVDFDGDARHPTLPDIGMDEGAFTPVVVDMAAGSFVDPPAAGTKTAGVAFSPQSSFQNAGNVTLTSIPVRFRIVRVGGPEVYNQTATIASLGPSASTTVTFPPATIAYGGSYTMICKVEMPGDTGAANDSATAGLTIAAPLNHAPVIVDMTDVIVHWGKTIVLSAVATDADRDPLMFSVSGQPSGLSIDGSTGVISWTPPNCPGGPYGRVTVIAMDPHKAADTTSFGIHEMPVFVPVCHVPSVWANKLEIVYPADTNHNYVENSLEGLPPTDSINVILYLNACIGQEERDTIQTYARIVDEMVTLSVMLVRALPTRFLNLAGLDYVSMVAKNHPIRSALQKTVPELQVVPNAPNGESIRDSLPGINGKGVKVAILDSGVDDEHPTFQAGKRYNGFNALPDSTLYTAAYEDGGSFISASVNGTMIPGNPDDVNGHGTFNAGIILGRGDLLSGANRGIAPGATLLDFQVLTDSSGVLIGREWNVEKAIDLLATDEKYDNDRIIVYLGIEGDLAGYGGNPDFWQGGVDAMSIAIGMHAADHLTFVVPVGNYDSNNPTDVQDLLPPAVCQDAIVVAASNDNGTVDRTDDTHPDTSKPGPRNNTGANPCDACPPAFLGLIPHFSAPGTHGSGGIVSAGKGPGYGYVAREGTCAAAAHVAGIAALLENFVPVGTGKRDELAADAYTGVADFTPENLGPGAPLWARGWGRGLVDPYKTLMRLRPALNVGFTSAADLQRPDDLNGLDSVDIHVTVHNTNAYFEIPGTLAKPALFVDLYYYYSGNSSSDNFLATLVFDDTLAAGASATRSYGWKLPTFSEPTGGLRAYIRPALKDGDPSDNIVRRDIQYWAPGSTGCNSSWPFKWFKRWSHGCDDVRSSDAQPLAKSLPRQQAIAQDFPVWVANLLPEDVQVSLNPTVVTGSGWTLACSESTFSFPMKKHEIPRLLAFLITPGPAATDSYVVDIQIAEKGACAQPWLSDGPRLVARLSSLIGVDGSRTRMPTLVMYPRPFRDHLDIGFDLPRKGPVGIRIYDIAGREVQRIDLDEQRAGPVNVRWNGRQRGGQNASPGVYFVRVRAPDVDLEGRVVHLR